VRGLRRPWASPLVQFVLASLLLFGVAWWATGLFSQRAARSEAVADARVTTELLARSVAEPAMPRGLVDGDPGAIDRFDREVLDRLLVGDVRRIKIWRADGTIVYSDETQLIGRRFTLDDEQRSVLDSGDTEGGVSTLRRQENRFESEEGGLLEVYTRIESPEGEPLLFEAYLSYDAVSARSSQLWRSFVGILLSSLLATLVLLTPLGWSLVNRTRRAQAQREALLQRAADVSLIERQRIAGALHDGLVQDLAAASYVVAAQAELADRRADPAAAQALRDTAGSVRSGIGGLRALLVDLYPPNLRSAGLASALRDVTSALESRGLRIESALDEAAIERLDEDRQEVVFRVGQEALRNAERHARAQQVRLTLTLRGDVVRLEVSDDGVGFDPQHEPGRDDSFGRRLMADQAERVGATLAVRTAPGLGTTIRLDVPVQ